MSNQEGADIGALSDLCTPWCIRVVATLQVADPIAAGWNQIDDLATAIGCDAYALHRALTTLVGVGVFEEPAPGRFALNIAAEGLCGPEGRLGLDLNGIGGCMAHTWSTLLSYVRTGKPAYQKLFGRPFWDDLDAHPEIAASFDALIGPAGHGTPDPGFDVTAGWDAVRTVVDVGGGTGAMLAETLRARPHLLGTLVDQPRTVALSSAIFTTAGVVERVTAVGQSFFDPLPPGADLYLLRGILNDFPDREAKAILSRCAQAARPSGRIVILGGVVRDNAPRPLMIEMVLLGRKLRSVTELRELAREAGLEAVAAGQQTCGHFVVECVPAV
jgi:hypothetical protein